MRKPCLTCIVFTISSLFCVGVIFLNVTELVSKHSAHGPEESNENQITSKDERQPLPAIFASTHPRVLTPNLHSKPVPPEKMTFQLINETDPSWETVGRDLKCTFTYFDGSERRREAIPIPVDAKSLEPGRYMEVNLDTRHRCVEEVSCNVTLTPENPPPGTYAFKNEVVERVPKSGCMSRAAIALRGTSAL